jgi:hypothetical protein
MQYINNRKKNNTMKKILIAAVVLLMGATTQAQVAKLSWTFSAKKLPGNKYEIRMVATPPAGWHTYSQFTPDGGPLPTEIKFNKNALVTLEGGIKEVGKLKTEYDKNFKVNVKYFEGKVEFVQIVKVKGPIKTNISGTADAMICSKSTCIPAATQNFNIALN